ncbi:topless-related protein 1 [Vigna angularis]|uniref:topless-related protein 1 n=1 Tax=Phaseolus angularis TaxID=3914 RepID=UPI00080A558A|nr:topless-related protein 1 [Vigna angularis]XP_052731951.1 topless-related protein 1 [Vigna angularis]
MENSALSKDLVFLTLQFLNEEGLKETAQRLECESGLYFNMKHFEEMLVVGKWNEAESYLSRFTRIDDNMHSTKIYFEIRKQKYLEALDIHDRGKALDILLKDLKVFFPGHEDLFNEMTQLLTVNDIREHASLSTYGDANSVRKIVADGIIKLVEENPQLHGKLKFPTFRKQRLYYLLNQSLNWQHKVCKDPLGVSDMKTFLMDRVSGSSLNPSSLQSEGSDSIENLQSETTMEDHNVLSLQGRPSQVSKENGYGKGLEDRRSNSIEESHKNSKLSNYLDICESSPCQFLELPTHPKISKIVRLTYTNEGNGILALASNGNHLLWKWPCNNLNPDGKVTTQVSPHIWQPRSDFQLMSNELASSYSGVPISSFSLSKNDLYLMSTSGGPISFFNMFSFKSLVTIMPPPPMPTCLAFYPRDNNILAIGLDDFSIIIYNASTNKIISKLEGHTQRVSDLAFSVSFDLLVSIGVKDQIFVWNTNEWKKLKDGYLKIYGQRVPDIPSETHIQFHLYQKHFLVVRSDCLAMYEATDLKCCNQWVPRVAGVICQATFSSDGQAVYVSFVDGTVAILDTLKFQLRCKINLSTYISTIPSSSMSPIAIAAHPHMPSQFVVGLTDGRAFVFEPRKSQDWSRFSL